MNHKAVYRTAPATPGLLNMVESGNHASRWIRDLWSKGISLILAYFYTFLSFCVLDDFFPFSKIFGFRVFLVHPTVVSVLLSASAERCFVSRMRDFYRLYQYFALSQQFYSTFQLVLVVFSSFFLTVFIFCIFFQQLLLRQGGGGGRANY